MTFLVDNQLPPALARFISEELKFKAFHVTDIGFRDAADAKIWDFASSGDYVLISKDDDFVTMFSRRPSARLLWIRLGNCRREFLLQVFKEQWGKILDRLESRREVH